MPPGRNIERPERADFKSLPPDLDIPYLIQSTPNFEHVTRIDARNINSDTMSDVEAYIHDHVIKKGLPLVIENWHLRSDWSSWIFNVQWLMQNHGQDRINIRDLKNQADIPMSFGHYLSNLKKLASKFHPNNFDGQGKQQRLYGKDLDCPPIWRQTLSDLLPQSTFYLSPIADLMSSLPEPARAENMMCYVGHEGTYTPAHKEMCASLGQNIMIATSEEDELPANRVGAAGLEGSSVWFMMGREDREVIAEYWLAQLGHDIEVEKHFASVEDLANAPFTVYIVEQKLGDYILVPPLAPHQVWNRGEYTLKAAWNRTTVDTLEFALNEALPKARLVCRDEQYKNRAIIYETLCKYLRELQSNNNVQSPDYIKGLRSREALAGDFVRLFNLFNTILLDQYFEVPGKEKEKSETKVEKIDNEYNVTCSFCRANIWNRFLSCGKCAVQGEDGEEDCYDVCIDCYARGRSCGCQSRLNWIEQEDWNGLLEKHEVFRNKVIEIQGTISASSPKKFYDALAELPRKTVARVCHEQNKVRPFIDVTKDPALESDDDTATVNAKKKSGQLLNCHVCKVRHDAWKSAACTSPGCSKAYCYGNLWRAFDMDPCDDVLVKFDWKCPVCLGVCSCGACQKNSKMKPHHPRGTFLGADTKNYVDPRSVEVLVDFRRGNLSWLKPGEVDPMARLKRKRSVEEDGDVLMGDGHARPPPTPTWSAINDQENAVEEAVPHVPIDPALSTSGDGSGSEANGHAAPHPAPEGHHSEHNDSLPSGGKPGGGQCTLSPKSSSNHLPSKKAMQTNPAIGMAGSRLQRGEGGDTRSSSGGIGILQQHIQQRLTLPSPSAMLTGALPPKHASSGSSSSHFSSHDSTHFNQHSYPYNTSIAENPHSSISSNEDTSNSNEDSHLSTLERNPIAFIAAAGLMQISNNHSQMFHLPPPTATPAHHVYHYENHPSLSGAGTSGQGVGVSGAGVPSHVNSNSNSYPSIHTITNPYSQNTPSSSYPSLRYTPMFATPKPPPVPAPLPPSLLGLHNSHASGSKGKHKRLDNAVGDLSHFEDKNSEREAVKLAWVKHQQKLAKDRKRWKQARRKSKIITLIVSSERLGELEDRWKTNESRKQSLLPTQADQSGEDLVTTDLAPVKKTPKKERMSEKPVAEASPPKSRRRVAPGGVEVSDDEENVSEGGPNEGVGDEEYRGWGARQFSKKKQSTMVPTKKSGRRVSRPEFFGETFTDSPKQGPSKGDGNEGYYDTDNEGRDEGLFCDHQTPVLAPARSESELRSLVEEEANRKLKEEKRAELERQREKDAEEARKRAEEEAEHARRLAEQKAKEEARQRELEKERKRKEEIAKAYRESKLLALKVATGEESLESWGDQEEESEVDEEEEVPVEELLPDWMRFAVVVDVEELLEREAYKAFDSAEFTALSMDSGISVDIPDLDINMDTPPPTSLASPPPPTKGKRRGRPREHTAKGPAKATTPSARSSVNPPISTPTTTTTSTRKPHRKTGGDDGTFRASKSRTPRAHKKPIPPADDSGTPTQPKRKKARPATIVGRRASAATKLQSSRASAAKPVRASSRKRKSLIQSYSFDSDEKKQDNSLPPEMYIDDDVDVPREIIDSIDLDLDPDVGVLEREERRARLMKQKETQRKRSASAIVPGIAGGEREEEEPAVKIEEEYNSRWRRRTVKW